MRRVRERSRHGALVRMAPADQLLDRFLLPERVASFVQRVHRCGALSRLSGRRQPELEREGDDRAGRDDLFAGD